MKQYPIGATWEGEEIDDYEFLYNKKVNLNRKAIIWLEKIENNLEIWRYSWSYSDGSAPVNSFDWGTSYQMCRNQIPFHCRMKRTK